MARPTKLTPELLEQAKGYLERKREADELPPSLAGLAVELDVSRSTIHKWKFDEKDAEFSDIYDKISEVQERMLLDKGLSGTYNTTIAKLMLTKHGYSDKTEQVGEQVIRQMIINRYVNTNETGDSGVESS